LDRIIDPSNAKEFIYCFTFEIDDDEEQFEKEHDEQDEYEADEYEQDEHEEEYGLV
jgi:hypothetical protein